MRMLEFLPIVAVQPTSDWLVVWQGPISLALWGSLIVVSCYGAHRVTARQRKIWHCLNEGLCPDCGYDMRGNSSGVCSECGRRVFRRRTI